MNTEYAKKNVLNTSNVPNIHKVLKLQKHIFELMHSNLLCKWNTFEIIKTNQVLITINTRSNLHEKQIFNTRILISPPNHIRNPYN